MTIALDYDGTYTADPKLWDVFLEAAYALGHKVVIMTMRYECEAIDSALHRQSHAGIIYTARQSKKDYCREHGIHIDIWIDDNPYWILYDASDRGVKIP